MWLGFPSVYNTYIAPSIHTIDCLLQETEFRSHLNSTLSSSRMRSAVIRRGFPSRYNLQFLRWVETHCPSLGLAECMIGTRQWPNCTLHSHNYWNRTFHAKLLLLVPESKPIPSSARMRFAVIEVALPSVFFLYRVLCFETHPPSLGLAEYCCGTTQWPNCTLYSHNCRKWSRHWEWRNPPSFSSKVNAKGLLSRVAKLDLLLYLISTSVALCALCLVCFSLLFLSMVSVDDATVWGLY